MAKELSAAEIAALQAASSDAVRMRMSRGGTLDQNYDKAGNETSVGGGGPGEDAPALRALARTFGDVRPSGFGGAEFSADNPYVTGAEDAAKGAQLASITSKAQGGSAATPGDIAAGRAANDVFAYENAKRRAQQMVGFSGVRRDW